jgi:hypothetical protein
MHLLRQLAEQQEEERRFEDVPLPEMFSNIRTRRRRNSEGEETTSERTDPGPGHVVLDINVQEIVNNLHIIR